MAACCHKDRDLGVFTQRNKRLFVDFYKTSGKMRGNDEKSSTLRVEDFEEFEESGNLAVRS